MSLAFVRTAGVPVDLFLEVLRPSALFAPTFDKKLGRMLEAEYENPTFPLRLLGKDLLLFEAAARGAGLDPAIVRGVLETIGAAERKGLADADYSALAEGLEGPPS